MNQDIIERFDLAKYRIREIPDEMNHMDNAYDSFYLDFFRSKAEYINYILDNYDKVTIDNINDYSLDYLSARNMNYYRDILPENYNLSYSNPDYSDERFEMFGPYFSFLSAELMNLPVILQSHIIDDSNSSGSLFETVILLELFLYLYGLFKEGNRPKISEVEEAVFYYAFDYVEEIAENRFVECTFPDEASVAGHIINKADLNDIRYLYLYGDHISDTEIKLSEYLSNLEEDEIIKIAHSFTDGFRRGYDVMGVDFTPKKYVNIRYNIGQERIVREAVKQFAEMGLEAVLSRGISNRIVRKGLIKAGYNSKSPNQQFEYDHRVDDRLFLESRFVKRRLDAAENYYKKYADKLKGFAGPAVIESFGEELFTPVVKDCVEQYSDSQNKLYVELYNGLGEISNKYLPGDSYSFTIIAFPVPDIGDKFDEIFRETLKINTLDNDKYIRIQQSIIDVLDRADKVRVIGMNGNKTDMTVQLRKLESPDKETQFENCTADVNIPLGEVFTSPVLKNTNGVLNVSSAFLNGYSFRNLTLEFSDGMVTDWKCDHEDGEEAAKRYIKENILFNHDTLPIGEFAIGTNTYAYSMAKKYNIIDKLPILIVEKTGPHFAVGDTCYSHAEEHAVYNPDGKEIISRENEISVLRRTEPEKAYFNCHTDITIPYNELGRLYTVSEDGAETDIIIDGRFVLTGTQELNEPLQ